MHFSLLFCYCVVWKTKILGKCPVVKRRMFQNNNRNWSIVSVYFDCQRYAIADSIRFKYFDKWSVSINSALVVTISGQQVFTQNPSLSLEISFDSESVHALDIIFTISVLLDGLMRTYV